jgi:hypothetical protein
MSNNNPSLDPAYNGSLVGSITFAFQKLMQNINGMLPAQVISYDRDTNRAEVQILLTILTTDGSQVPRPKVASVPVIIMGGGGFVLSFPLKPGNLGWILANDRDISAFLQNYTQSPPNTNRIKNFSDGVFIPDVMTGTTFAGSDSDAFVLQSLDGLTKISISDTEINIVSPTQININSPAISIDMGLPTNVLQLNGSLNATGTITP